MWCEVFKGTSEGRLGARLVKSVVNRVCRR